MSQIDSGLINGADLIGGLIQQGQKSSDYVDGLFDAHAKKQAGLALASGDPETAATLLGGRGYVAEAQALRDRADAATTMSSLNTGDYAGAKTTAAASGDPALYNSAVQAQQQDRQARAAWLSHAADAMLQIKDPDPATQAQKRSQAFAAAVAPTMKAMGVPEAQISQIQGQSLTDDNLNAFKASLGQVSTLSIQKMDDGSILGIDPKTGEVHTLYKGSPKADWKEVKHADGSTTWIDLNSGPPGGGEPMPGPSGSGSSGSRGARNNNPLNLTNLPQGQWDGQTGSDGRFAVFATPEAGMAAADKNLQAYATHHGINTIAGIVNRWAPAGDGANNPQAYAATVANDVGVKADAPLDLSDPAVRTRILTAMSKVELGGSGAAPVKASGPRTMPGSEAPSDDGALSDDAIEQAAERYLTNGQLPPMGMGKTGTANRDKILNKAAEMEKASGRTGAEAVAAWAGVKANAVTLSKLTQNRGVVKTFEDTAERNGDLALSLAPKGAAPLNVPVLNKWVQTGRKAVLGDPNVTQFDVAMGTFLDEYAKVTTGATGGTGTSDAARKEAYDRISRFATQGQLAAGIATMKQEMGNRISAMDDEINATQARISGKSAQPPHAAALAPLANTTPAQEATRARYQNTGKPAGDQGNPYVPRSKAEFAAIKSGQWFINPADGQVMQKR